MTDPRPALVLLALTSAACSTLPGARPLQPGRHAVGVTLGGPFVDAGPVIPLPMVNLEGRSGITRLAHRPLDANYGLNLTPLAFGVLQGHVGSSWLIAPENGWLPSLSVTERIFFAANVFGRGEDAPGAFGLWGMNQLEIDVAHNIGEHFMWWAGLAQYLDFSDPALLLTPVLGLWFDPGGPGGLGVGIEGRWYAINRKPAVDTIDWKPGPNGAVGLALMVSYVF